MKKYNYLFLFLLFFVACTENDNKTSETSENDADAARNFIRAALDGKFNEARVFMLNDSLNTNYLDVAERSYQRAGQDLKDGYRTSTIIIHSIDPVIKDSVSVVIYSNSYKNDRDTLKVIKTKDRWLVDLKYLFEHDTDTLLNKPALNDTIK